MCLRRVLPGAAVGNATRGWEVCRWISGEGLGTRLTIRMQACFPSMKPLGMAFAARISYLETQCRSHDRAHLRCHQLPLRPACSPHPPPTPSPPAPAGRPTVGGTPGRRSCWGSPGGRFGCLPRPRCTAAAPAPGRRPACPTAEMQRAVGCWGLREQQAPNLRPGDPPRQATAGSPGAPGEGSAEGLVPPLLLAPASPGASSLSPPRFLPIASSTAPTSRTSPHPPTSLGTAIHSPPSSPAPMTTVALCCLPRPVLPLPLPHLVSKMQI